MSIHLHKLLRERLNRTGGCFGSWLMSRDPIMAEILASSGFDWLAVDMEHAPITLSEAADLIRAGNGQGCPMLVRLPSHDVVLAKQVLDAGASGLIFPDVRSEIQAKALAEAVRYPRQGIGSRGVGLGRASGFGKNFPEYFASWNDLVVVVAQIEHRDALTEVDAIAGTAGIDGLFVGPYDMSASMDLAGQMDHPELLAAVDKVVGAARKVGKHAGFHAVPVDIKSALALRDRGATLLAFSADVFMVRDCAERFIKTARASAS